MDEPKDVKKPRSIFKTLFAVSYIGLAVSLVLLFVFMHTSLAGWLIALGILLVSAGAQFTLDEKKGCSTAFIIFLLTLAALMAVFLLTTDTSAFMD